MPRSRPRVRAPSIALKASALADAFYLLGANVIFISSYDYNVPYKLLKFDSSFGLQSALLTQKMNAGDIVIMAAAVSDFIPNKVKGKISKDDVDGVLTLNFRKNEDIISKITTPGVKKIGFKLEVKQSSSVDLAKKALKDKGLDAICLNVLNDVLTFGSENTKISFISKNKDIETIEGPKQSVAFKLAELIKSLFDE